MSARGESRLQKGAPNHPVGEPGFPSGLEDDAWSVIYPQFDSLSWVSHG
jgi:hypothetical protein